MDAALSQRRGPRGLARHLSGCLVPGTSDCRFQRFSGSEVLGDQDCVWVEGFAGWGRPA